MGVKGRFEELLREAIGAEEGLKGVLPYSLWGTVCSQP